MAKLKAHGIELNRREYPTQRVAVMSDGNIMRDFGCGWKLWKRIKAGVDVAEYVKDIQAKYEARPASFHAYMKALKSAAPIAYRGQLHEAITLMRDDPDGVWSTFDGSYTVEIDIDDCVKLCRLYTVATSEGIPS